MALTFDFTNYKDTSTAHVPAGTYHAEVSDFEETVSKADNVMFVVYLRITEGPYAGQQIIDRLPQTERALFRSAPLLMGTSHRAAPVRHVVASFKDGLRSLLSVPEGYEIVLGNGGASAFWDVGRAGPLSSRAVVSIEAP